ncbi:hypothetical protein [Runella aurantiaca]|uniref:Uncharacterized protein n=1 Tax=Runella aurantiaca TaxID=2282308 RepID=A0A369IDQ3_9BACT|nr:hypothetical protein [Runella aurantiaca]RDB06395.1 hypothetical protein DVG78_09055 [Runella aurantiaca]
MKIKKYTISVLSYLLLGFCGCKKSDVIPIKSLSCDWPPNYSVEAKIVDIVTTVHQSFWEDTAYIIRNPSLTDTAPFWGACNMPDKAKKDGIKVKVSGYIITFPGIEGVQFKHGRPFELISIEYL